MILLDGKAVAEHRREALKIRTENFRRQTGRAPHLTVVLIGEDAASQVYVKNKHLACQKVGLSSVILQKPASTTEQELRKILIDLQKDDKVDGILVQFPLPSGLKSETVLENLAVEKDADGLTDLACGRLWGGRALVKPCTPAGILHILSHYKISVRGMNAVVVGRSQIVGKPMAALLLEENATVTLCHRHTNDLRKFTQAADLVIVAAGQPRFLGREDFNSHSIVVDVGMHGTGGGKLCGDVRFEELNGFVRALTPVPGGVGPMTITTLLENTLVLAERRLGFPSTELQK